MSRHAKYDEMAALIRNGASDQDVATALGVSRRSASKVRRELGVPKWTRPVPALDEKFSQHAVPDLDGHTGWDGYYSAYGIAMIRRRGKHTPASHCAFEQRAGRPPVGQVRAECGVRSCLTGEHLGDELERRTVRMQERAVHGLDPQPWDVCSKGLHTWEEAGRLQPDLTPYCRECNTTRSAVNRARREA